MVGLKIKNTVHPDEAVLAGFLAGSLPKNERRLMEKHLSSCDQCLEVIVEAHNSVSLFNEKRSNKRERKQSIIQSTL